MMPPGMDPLALGCLHVVIAVGVTIHTLIHKRDVSAAIGWIGMAWLSPVVGALLYISFGVNRVKRRARELRPSVPTGDGPSTGDNSSADPIERLKVVVGEITNQDMANAEVVAIFDNGDQGYPEMLSAIESAEFSVSLCTFIFRDDALGEQFIAALSRAHLRGVKVRVLIDGFGGGLVLSRVYHSLHKLGVPVARFLHSLLPWKIPFLDLRLHKKCLVIDSAMVFVGGLNIGAENIVAAHPKFAVSDCHFKIEGAIVGQIEQQFDDDWAFTTGQAPLAAKTPIRPASQARAPARAIVTGPDQEAERLVLVLLSAINAARQSIRIATPYFVPAEELVTALQLAALRGVAVHIVLPARNNHLLVGWAMRPHIRPLLVSGCAIWLSPPPFDHSKLMTIDGQWSLIGSANWDMRSLRLNFEMTFELYNREFATALGDRIDTRCVRRMSLTEIDKRPFVFKLRDAAARLTMPYI
jgi:cardiolipin synthase